MEHSVRSCPKCDPGEVNLLMKQRKSQTEKLNAVSRVKIAAIRDSGGEVKTTVDGIANVNTFLDSNPDCRMASAGLVKALSKEKFLAIKELKSPVKIETVG